MNIPSCISAMLLLACAMQPECRAEAVHTVYTFQKTSLMDGAGPVGGLTKFGKALYGVTLFGGSCASGTLYRIAPFRIGPNAPEMMEELLYNFGGHDGCGGKSQSDGAGPNTAVIFVGHILYGTTIAGGRHDKGTIFSYDITKRTGGAYKLLYSFSGGPDGQKPAGRLVYSQTDDALYGTTLQGGTALGYDRSGVGTVYRFPLAQTAPASDSIVHTFTGGTFDGASPRAGLTLANGMLYGTTSAGDGSPNCFGDLGCGIIFSIDPAAGAYTPLYAFQGGTTDGATPTQEMTDGNNGYLYGTTQNGGRGCGNNGCGTLFRYFVGAPAPAGLPPVTPPPPGIITSLSGASGISSSGPLTILRERAPPGTVGRGRIIGYGAAVAGGQAASPLSPFGTVFSADLSKPDAPSSPSALVDFTQIAGECDAQLCQGGRPTGQLVFVEGYAYGVTFQGGNDNAGTVFAIKQ